MYIENLKFKHEHICMSNIITNRDNIDHGVFTVYVVRVFKN